VQKYLTPEQVAETLQTSLWVVTKLCRAGAFDGAFKVGGKSWRISEDALAAYIENEAVKAEQQRAAS
jgi:excisionase family DNA binding protein